MTNKVYSNFEKITHFINTRATINEVENFAKIMKPLNEAINIRLGIKNEKSSRY